MTVMGTVMNEWVMGFCPCFCFFRHVEQQAVSLGTEPQGVRLGTESRSWCVS